MRIAFLDVGQGETTVISLPATREAVVVDCLDADNTIEYLESQQIQHVRALIITHLHLDHYGEAVQFLENCPSHIGLTCDRLLFNYLSSTSWGNVASIQDDHSEGQSAEPTRTRRRRTALQQFYGWANRNPTATRSVALQAGDGELVPGAINSVLELIHPQYGQAPTLQRAGFNNTAAVLKVYGTGTSALLTSDIEPSGWQTLLTNHPDVRSHVLSFPHHGAWKNANPSELLDQVDPSIVVISVGTEGVQYDHPNLEVFAAIANRPGVRLMCTQATVACELLVEAKRSQVVTDLRLHSETRNQKSLVCRNGCPCAGTVIIDLGEQVEVIQPEASFHRDTIILPNFHRHQCRI